MLQEISESSSNRIVQRISWSKERRLGLRNRSIFILLSVLFQPLMSEVPQTRPDARRGSRTRMTHAHARVRVYIAVQSGLVTPWDGGWGGGWLDGWIREQMDAAEKDGRRAFIRLQPAHWWIYRTEDGFPSTPPPPLSLPLAHPHFTSVLWPFSLLLIAITSKWHGRPGECRLPCPVDTLWL